MNCESKRLPTVSHDVVHHIVTHGPPIASKFQKLDNEKFAASEFYQLNNIIQLSTSPWSTLLHMVRKADGSWRPCRDFRRLNLLTEPDIHLLPNMLDFAVGCTVFSKIDLWKGYHHIPINPEDVQKTDITTLFGLFEYKQIPLGSRNAGSSFLRHMDQAIRLCLRNAGPSFQGCVDRAIRDCHAAFAWVDNIVIYSRTTSSILSTCDRSCRLYRTTDS